MDLTALIDLLAARVAEEINTVRSEVLALVQGPTASAFSLGLVAFDGGSAVLAAGTPVVSGGGVTASIADRIAQEFGAVRAEVLAFLQGPNASATSVNVLAFNGGAAALAGGTPVVNGGDGSAAILIGYADGGNA